MKNKLIQNLQNYERALISLETNIIKLKAMAKEEEDYDIYRDSTIQRFEYSIESAKKLMSNYIEYEDGVKIAGQNRIIKEAFKFDLIDDDIWFEMVDDRNITAHEYSEKLAQEIAEKIFIYAIKLRIFHDTIKNMID